MSNIICEKCGMETDHGSVHLEKYVHFQGQDRKFVFSYAFSVLESPKSKHEIYLCKTCMDECCEEAVKEIHNRIKKEMK